MESNGDLQTSIVTCAQGGEVASLAVRFTKLDN